MAEDTAANENVDHSNLTITGAHKDVTLDGLTVDEDVVIIVTRAFGPKGDNLVGISDQTFDDYPAVTVGVRVGDKEGLVHMSPIHGDRRKAGFVDIEDGARCELFCPVSKEVLPKVGPVEDGSGAEYYAIYLTPKLSQGAMVAISDMWGHYHSRIVDDNELISYWAAHQT